LEKYNIRIVLASQSPRRREILVAAGFEFTVRPANVVEERRTEESADDYVRRVALDKASAIARAENEIVLGADTEVVIHDQVLGKPRDAADAARMLRLLAGREHDVITGICLLAGATRIVDSACTRVEFAALTDREIDEYVASGEPMDKAGAYGIQGLASRFITRIEGEYFNVVGLPIALVYRRLHELLSRTG
jgi:septum formation protein